VKKTPAKAKPAVPRRETIPKPALEVSEDSISDDIAQLAYSLWEARGRSGGSPEEDWYRAEHLIRSKTQV
jgi:hypothetical protein